MIIAQGSIAIDENAKLANDAVVHADKNKRQVESLLGGKITQSTLAPGDANDKNQHQEGDLWIQVGSDGTAINMFNYTNGAWVPHHWDAQALSVKQLSALTADLGTINTGTINSVTINGVELNIDIDGDGGAHDSGINPRQWTAGDNWLNNGMDMGFHFQNGLMRWRGQRVGGDGTYDATFIGPNDIKVRNSNDWTTGFASINSRADILSDSITIGQGYGTPSVGSNDSCQLKADGTATITQTLTVDALNTNSGTPTKYDWFMDSGGGLTCNNIVCPTLDSIRGQISDITTKTHKTKSDLSIKDHISRFSEKDALREINGTDIYQYEYKGSHDIVNIGPVIDNVHSIKQSEYNTSSYLVSDDGNNSHSIKTINSIGLLIGAVKELSNQNEALLARITKLEMDKNGSN